MACCSNQCERRNKCAHYIGNPSENDGVESVVNWYSHGWASYSDTGCEQHWDCGPHGNWGMFSPVNVELLKKQRDSLDKLIGELERGEFD